MSTKNELERFLDLWEIETHHTRKVLKALPPGSYDFRPYPECRSIGEMSWHLVELEAYMTFAIESGGLKLGAKPPGIERPRTIAELEPAFERVHSEALARVKKLTVEDLDREIGHFDGRPIAIRQMLWIALLHHAIHHRGQLMMMVRIAGAAAPAIYGPNREESAAIRARVEAQPKV